MSASLSATTWTKVTVESLVPVSLLSGPQSLYRLQSKCFSARYYHDHSNCINSYWFPSRYYRIIIEQHHCTESLVPVSLLSGPQSLYRVNGSRLDTTKTLVIVESHWFLARYPYSIHCREALVLGSLLPRLQSL